MSSEILSNVSIFCDLNDSELLNVEKFFNKRSYPKGSMIILEEEFGDTIFIVAKGTIKITRVNDEGKEVILALMGKYEIFGEMSVIDGEARLSQCSSTREL